MDSERIEDYLACSLGKVNLGSFLYVLIGFATIFVFFIPATVFPIAYTR